MFYNFPYIYIQTTVLESPCMYFNANVVLHYVESIFFVIFLWSLSFPNYQFSLTTYPPILGKLFRVSQIRWFYTKYLENYQK